MTNESTGIIYKILNILCFVIIGLVNQGTMQDLGAFQTFFLSCLSTLLILAIIIKTSTKASLIAYVKSVDKTFFYVALTSFISLSTFIYALQLVDISIVSAASNLTPVAISIFGVFALKERFSLSILAALIISISGTLLMVLPTLHNSLKTIGIISAIISAIGWAIYDFLLKKQSQMHWAKQSFILLALCAPVSLPFAAATWKPLTLTHVKFFVLLGILYSINKMFLIKALAHTRLILLAPIIYTKFIFAAAFSYLLFNKIIHINTILGSIMIAASAVLLMYSTKNVAGHTKDNQ